MMILMVPIRKEDAKPDRVSACVAMYAIETQATTAIVPLIAGSVASSNLISIVEGGMRLEGFAALLICALV
jgi:hypothetical protein